MAKESEKGFLSSAWKANKTVVGYIGLYTLGVWGALFKAAVNVKGADPEAGLVDIVGEHFGVMIGNTATYGMEGVSIIFNEIAAVAADIAVPFMGDAVRMLNPLPVP